MNRPNLAPHVTTEPEGRLRVDVKDACAMVRYPGENNVFAAFALDRMAIRSLAFLPCT
jgi:hypothetical protein